MTGFFNLLIPWFFTFEQDHSRRNKRTGRNTTFEVRRESIDKVEFKVKEIYSAIKDIIKVSQEKQIPTQDVAELLAMEKVDLMGG